MRGLDPTEREHLDTPAAGRRVARRQPDRHRQRVRPELRRLLAAWTAWPEAGPGATPCPRASGEAR